MEQAGLPREHVVVHGGAPGGLAHQGDPGGVAAEHLDVVLHPAQRHALVLEPRVGGPTRRVPEGQEAQDAQPVVDVHHNDVFLEEEVRSVDMAVGGARVEGAPVDPYDDRSQAVRGCGRR